VQFQEQRLSPRGGERGGGTLTSSRTDPPLRAAEFRRMKPLLDQQGVEAFAVDMLGNGFCASGLESNPEADLGPQQRRQHLYAFWKSQVACLPLARKNYQEQMRRV
jgi:hypothetical protein